MTKLTPFIKKLHKKHYIAIYFLIIFLAFLSFINFNAVELYASEIETTANLTKVDNENKEWALYAGNLFEDVLKAVSEGVKQGINEGLKSTSGQGNNTNSKTNSGQTAQQEEPQTTQRRSITDMSENAGSDTNLPTSSSAPTDIEAPIQTKSKQPVIVTVDGICTEAEHDIIFNDMCWTSYLRDAFSSELADYLVAPFQWTGDTRDTKTTLENAKKYIEGFYKVAQKRGTTFEIIAHSWGSVLTYIVLKQNPNIKVDTFITLGSPLRSNRLEIRKYTEKYTGNNVDKLSNVGKWVNYWAWNDLISGAIKAANKNFQIDTVATITDTETRMAATKDFHSKYYTEWKSSIISELVQQMKTPQLSEYKFTSWSDLIEVTVTGVDDGDTIKVNYKGKDWQVRLIGIDTPETVRGDKLNHDAEEWNIPASKVLEMGEEAKRYMESLLKKGDKVRLEFDENSEVRNGEKIDPYNRLLAYVYLNNGTFLNFQLLRIGYAKFTPRNWSDGFEFPEKKYQELFQGLEDLAKSKKEGFWKIWNTPIMTLPYKLKVPYEDYGASRFRGYSYGEWVANNETAIRQDRNEKSRIAYQVQKGEKVSSVTGVVITKRPGQAKVLGAAQFGTSFFVKTGDIIYILRDHGDGYFKVWFNGKIFDDVSFEDTDSTIEFKSKPEIVWWVKIKNSNGQIGWTDQPDNFDNKETVGDAY